MERIRASLLGGGGVIKMVACLLGEWVGFIAICWGMGGGVRGGGKLVGQSKCSSFPIYDDVLYCVMESKVWEYDFE